MGQRRRRDPLKLVSADKINRGESFAGATGLLLCVSPGVPGSARTASVQMP